MPIPAVPGPWDAASPIDLHRRLPSVTVLAGREVAVASEVLGLELRDEREARMVRLRDPATGHDLLTYEELEARVRDLEDGMSPETARIRKPAR